MEVTQDEDIIARNFAETKAITSNESDSTDKVTFYSQLWKVLATVPHLTEAHHQFIIPIFFRSIQLEEHNQKYRVKLKGTRDILKNILGLFAKFQNPKKFSDSAKLRAVFEG
jgi:hypothetical protein